MIELCYGLSFNKGLQVLRLSHNEIESEGCKKLVESLNYHEAIRDIDLSSNMISVEALTDMLNLMKDSQTLSILNVVGIYTSEEIIALEPVLMGITLMPNKTLLY